MAMNNLFKIDLKAPVQKITLTEDGTKLKAPFTMTISGPSQCGKSEFIFNLIKFRNDVVTADFKRIIYCQSNCFSAKNLQFFDRLKKEFEPLEILQGLPDINELQLTFNNEPALLIVDDLMNDVINSKKMVEIATIHAHNFNLSVVFVLQNFYASGKFSTTLQRNSQYKVLFYNSADLSELRHLSSQMSNNPKFLSLCFEYLMNNFPNSKSFYLLIDAHYRSNIKKFWCRSHLFPEVPKGEIIPIVFFPNKN
jgi:hypothetical protein